MVCTDGGASADAMTGPLEMILGGLFMSVEGSPHEDAGMCGIIINLTEEIRLLVTGP